MLVSWLARKRREFECWGVKGEGRSLHCGRGSEPTTSVGIGILLDLNPLFTGKLC